MRKSGQRTTIRTASVSVHGLRNKKLLEAAVDPNLSEAVLPPSQEAIRQALEANLCPWCGKGPWANVAGHTVRVHGIDRFEIRDLAGITYSTSITSDALRQRNSERARELGPPPSVPGPQRARKRYSAAGRAVQAAKLEKTRSPEQRALAAAASRTPEALAKRSASTRRAMEAKLGPPEHGTRRMYKTYRCRCETCRAANAARARAQRAAGAAQG